MSNKCYFVSVWNSVGVCGYQSNLKYCVTPRSHNIPKVFRFLTNIILKYQQQLKMSQQKVFQVTPIKKQTMFDIHNTSNSHWICQHRQIALFKRVFSANCSFWLRKFFHFGEIRKPPLNENKYCCINSSKWHTVDLLMY